MGCCLHTTTSTSKRGELLEVEDRRLVRIVLEPCGSGDDDNEVTEILFNQSSDSDSVDEEDYYVEYTTVDDIPVAQQRRSTTFPHRVLCQTLAMAREQANGASLDKQKDVEEIRRCYGRAIAACSPAQLAIRKKIIREYERLRSHLTEPLAVPLVTVEEMLRTARDRLESESVRRQFYRAAIRGTWNGSRANVLKQEYNQFIAMSRVRNVIEAEQEAKTEQSANQ